MTTTVPWTWTKELKSVLYEYTDNASSQARVSAHGFRNCVLRPWLVMMTKWCSRYDTSHTGTTIQFWGHGGVENFWNKEVGPSPCELCTSLHETFHIDCCSKSEKKIKVLQIDFEINKFLMTKASAPAPYKLTGIPLKRSSFFCHMFQLR